MGAGAAPTLYVTSVNSGSVTPINTATNVKFLLNYPVGQWISRERERLTCAIERAAGEHTGNEGISR